MRNQKEIKTTSEKEVESPTDLKTEDKNKRGLNLSFYITNLESGSLKDRVKSEFSKFGVIDEICVKKSCYTKYYLAYIRCLSVKDSAEDIISSLYRK